jgi:phenylacetate-CoA ligase
MRSGRRDLKLEAYLGFAGAFTEDMRGMIREYLGAKVIERYSAEETGIIARQCPRHDHLHVLTPLCIVEIVDENNRPCAIGEPGRILVTALHSYGMPFLRYDIGDIGVWGERCDCGINLPVLKQIIGRVRHRITNPDGREVTVRFYARDFDRFPEIEEYRFVLHRGSIVVAQIKSKEATDRLRQALIKIIQDTLEYPYAVTVNFVETIDWGKSLKKEIFNTSDEAVNA